MGQLQLGCILAPCLLLAVLLAVLPGMVCQLHAEACRCLQDCTHSPAAVYMTNTQVAADLV